MSPGTSTSSTTSLNSQISAVVIAVPAAIRKISSGSQRRYGRASGQKRRKTSRRLSSGAWATVSP
jgi:hypothetical protein